MSSASNLNHTSGQWALKDSLTHDAQRLPELALKGWADWYLVLLPKEPLTNVCLQKQKESWEHICACFLQVFSEYVVSPGIKNKQTKRQWSISTISLGWSDHPLSPGSLKYCPTNLSQKGSSAPVLLKALLLQWCACLAHFVVILDLTVYVAQEALGLNCQCGFMSVLS